MQKQAETLGRTGVETEALTAVQVALLTVYDMIKAVGRGAFATDMGGAHARLALESPRRSGALRWSAAPDRSRIGAHIRGTITGQSDPAG